MSAADNVNRWARAALVLGFALLCLIVLLPLLLVVIETVFIDVDGHRQVSLAHYADFFSTAEHYLVVGRTLLLSATTTLLAATIGFVFAWLAIRTNVPGGQWMHLAMMIPLLIPPSLGAISWVLLLNPSSGLVNLWLGRIFPQGLFNIYSFSGMVFVEFLSGLPLAFMLFYANLSATDPILEEAAAASGASVWETFKRVTMPRMAPHFLSVLVILFLLGIESFDVGWFLGYPAKLNLLSVEMFVRSRLAEPADLGGAAIFGVCLIVLTLLLVRFYRKFLAQALHLTVQRGKQYKHHPFDIGRYRWIASASFYLLIVLGGLMPLLVMLASSLDLSLDSSIWSLSPRLYHYRWVVEDVTSWQAVMNSVWVCLGGALVAICLGFPCAVFFIKANQTFRQAIAYLTFTPFVLPTSLLSLGVFVAFDQSAVYGTVWLLLLGFCLKAVPISIHHIQESVLKVHDDGELAARASGSGFLPTVGRIVLPMVSPSLLSAWLLLFLLFMRQSNLPLMLATPDVEVMSTVLFQEWKAGAVGHVAAYGMLIVTSSLILVVLARWLIRAQVVVKKPSSLLTNSSHRHATHH